MLKLFRKIRHDLIAIYNIYKATHNQYNIYKATHNYLTKYQVPNIQILLWVAC